MADDHQKDQNGQNDQEPGPASAAEWGVAGVGLLLVLGVIGTLAGEAATSTGRPPDVTVAVDTVVRGRGGWTVRFEARNGGDEAAVALTVRGTLALPGGRAVEREAEVDYLPARSARGGGLVFPVDPRAGALRLEAVGYEDP